MNCGKYDLLDDLPEVCKVAMGCADNQRSRLRQGGVTFRPSRSSRAGSFGRETALINVKIVELAQGWIRSFYRAQIFTETGRFSNTEQGRRLSETSGLRAHMFNFGTALAVVERKRGPKNDRIRSPLCELDALFAVLFHLSSDKMCSVGASNKNDDDISKKSDHEREKA